MKIKAQVETSHKPATARYMAYADAFAKLTKENNKKKEGN